MVINPFDINSKNDSIPLPTTSTSAKIVFPRSALLRSKNRYMVDIDILRLNVCLFHN